MASICEMSLVLKVFMFSDVLEGHTGFGFGSMEQDLQRQQSVQIYSVNSGSKPAAFFFGGILKSL